MQANPSSQLPSEATLEESADDLTGVPVSDISSDTAIAAWARRFKNRQVELTRDEREPFAPGRRLGGGGVGIVHETHIESIPLALKRTYARRLTPYQLNEIKILGRISESRHRHVVELIGSYIHHQRTGYELGILIWPVAQSDLAALLHDFEVFNGYVELSHGTTYRVVGNKEEMSAAMEPLMPLLDMGTTGVAGALQVLERGHERIRRSIGCIATAVAYLHSQGIRHKDLKPSQILLSSNWGLWLTDFGWSRDMSELSQSATSGGDSTTYKYQAPERTNREPCGWAEDIFGLGCIFLEMSYNVWGIMSAPRPWSAKGWSFQSNLDHIQEWIKPLQGQAADLSPSDTANMPFSLSILIVEMLAYDAKDRPSIQVLVETLIQPHSATHIGFSGPCCLLPVVPPTEDTDEIHDDVWLQSLSGLSLSLRPQNNEESRSESSWSTRPQRSSHQLSPGASQEEPSQDDQPNTNEITQATEEQQGDSTQYTASSKPESRAMKRSPMFTLGESSGEEKWEFPSYHNSSAPDQDDSSDVSDWEYDDDHDSGAESISFHRRTSAIGLESRRSLLTTALYEAGNQGSAAAVHEVDK